MYKFVYFCLFFMAVANGKWSRVSDMVKVDHKVTLESFDQFRKFVESHVQTLYSGQLVSLEEYKLVGAEITYQCVEDADLALRYSNELGIAASVEGTTLSLTYKHDYE